MRIGGILAKFMIAMSAAGCIILVDASVPAGAQDAASMSCGELWHARNAIYARRGYCFETERARATFGPGCFPPFGHLKGWERDRVNELQMWERRKGC